jgi:hypothetical protein
MSPIFSKILKSRSLNANFAYDNAITIATLDNDRQSLMTAKEAFNHYVATAQEIAAIQIEIIELRTQRMTENATWFKSVDTLINSASVSLASNRHALESNLQQANSEFMREAVQCLCNTMIVSLRAL